MKQIAIISGKGGTGKTSITAALAALAKNKVMADCDVDAADLHLILTPEIRRREKFVSGKTARIDPDKCVQCGQCINICRFDAIDGKLVIDPISCEGCGLCARICPAGAIELTDNTCGEWFISNTRFGPMVHARLKPGAENSGKLVSLVRRQALAIAKEKALEYIIIDGPPGTGCPVIASITGVNLVLVVVEPTLSGIHDLKRIIELTSHFKIKTMACINKCDINPENTEEIKKFCRKAGAEAAAEIPYDRAFTEAMVQGRSIAETENQPLVKLIEKLWQKIR